MSRKIIPFIVAFILICLVMGVSGVFAFSGAVTAEKFGGKVAWSKSYSTGESMKVINLMGDDQDELFIQNTTNVTIFDGGGNILFSREYQYPKTTIAIPLGGQGAYGLAAFIADEMNFTLLGYRIVPSALLIQTLVGLLVPLIAVVISRVIPMEEALAIGLVVYALAAGTEGGPKFVQLAKGNTGFAVGLLAVLLTITVVFMPGVLSLAVPDAHVDRGQLLVKLLAAVALPMGLGLVLRARSASLADRLSIVMHRASVGLLCVLFLQLVYVNFDAILAMQSGALLGGLLFFAVAGPVGEVVVNP